MMKYNDKAVMKAVAICYKPYLKPEEAMIYCNLGRRNPCKSIVINEIQGLSSAQDWIRTSTSLRTLRPEHSASTNFATWAIFISHQVIGSLSHWRVIKPFALLTQ
jgi:hypothetical protein